MDRCLVGGWTNPSEKYLSKWESSTNRGEKKQISETPHNSIYTWFSRAHRACGGQTWCLALRIQNYPQSRIYGRNIPYHTRIVSLIPFLGRTWILTGKPFYIILYINTCYLVYLQPIFEKYVRQIGSSHKICPKIQGRPLLVINEAITLKRPCKRLTGVINLLLGAP